MQNTTLPLELTPKKPYQPPVVEIAQSWLLFFLLSVFLNELWPPVGGSRLQIIKVNTFHCRP